MYIYMYIYIYIYIYIYNVINMKDELTKAVSRSILNNVFSLLNTLQNMEM